jgi:2,4-didehydro-3-deoxy-L-rhamnonate hydrolase
MDGELMRVANIAGRAVLLDGARALDVELASSRRFNSAPQELFERWSELRSWAESADLSRAVPFKPEDLGPPVPMPRQVFAVGLNFPLHAAESGIDVSSGEPSVFTKFPSCITGPYAEVRLPRGGHVDWEVELVVVIGHHARDVSEHDAWNYVAGLCVGQDISERILQMAAVTQQFSLGKSFANFGPIGPWLTTIEEIEDPNDIALECALNGEVVQRGRTSDLIFPVPVLIAKLSSVVTLLPGDIIFTGTPPGVGIARNPPRWLHADDLLVSHAQGIGELRNRFAG